MSESKSVPIMPASTPYLNSAANWRVKRWGIAWPSRKWLGRQNIFAPVFPHPSHWRFIQACSSAVRGYMPPEGHIPTQTFGLSCTPEVGATK